MNNDELFKDLSLPKFKQLANKWSRNYSFIEKILLYPGRESGNNYVLVFIAPQITDPNDSLYDNYQEFYKWVNGPAFGIDKDLATAYKDKTPKDFLNEWTPFIEKPDDGLSSEFIGTERPEYIWTFYGNKWLRGEDLMKVWSITAFELYQIISEGELPFYKDAHVPIKYQPGELEFELEADRLDNDIDKWAFKAKLYVEVIPQLLLKKSDVEKYEKEKGLGNYSTTVGDTPKEIVSGNDKVSEIQEQKVFPCKPGTKWEDIKITLIDENTIRVKTPQREGRFTYHELGMSDKRKGNPPTTLWILLRLFAENKGNISSNNINYISTLPSTAKRLNKHLQKVFGIKDSIYKYHYKKYQAYITKIHFSDQRFSKKIDIDKDDSEKTLHESEVKDIQNKHGITEIQRFDG